ncbi:MAG TPA: MBL fold metallo-hydrolase [Nitrososphaera sp.]|jgi:L-ascorbate metabolism protein UlaG (beta-lactamase superfamily)|nr:MBL fold metallo-hydrolase [Nitrososphaera sp.]
MLEHNGISFQWLGHDGFRISYESKTVYFDPYKLKSQHNKKDADLVLISHNHFDHLSVEDLALVVGSKTHIVAAEECVGKLKSIGAAEIKGVAPGDRASIEGVSIEAVAAYNTNKTFHPKADGKVGFVITLNNLRIYHAGDTDVIPEMDGVNPDIALVPVSGTYVMTAEEAARSVN